MIYAAAEELLQLMAMGVFTDNGTTVKDCWDQGVSPLRPSEAPILSVGASVRASVRADDGLRNLLWKFRCAVSVRPV